MRLPLPLVALSVAAALGLGLTACGDSGPAAPTTTATVPSGTLGNASGYHGFHTHIDAYGKADDNCRGASWTSTTAHCRGTGGSGNAGTAGSISGPVLVQWCTYLPNCAEAADRQLQLPSGYSRWMKVCNYHGTGTCRDYVFGAVKMPNGPFAVMAGKFAGHALKPTSLDEGQVGKNGGPLFLYVGFHSNVDLGDGGKSIPGYVFGLRGYLLW